MLHALAFIIWDIGSRPPSKFFADATEALRSLKVFARALWQFALGWIVLVAGAVLMLSVTLVDVRREFTILEAIAVVSGLVIEMLVGPPLRTGLAQRRLSSMK